MLTRCGHCHAAYHLADEDAHLEWHRQQAAVLDDLIATVTGLVGAVHQLVALAGSDPEPGPADTFPVLPDEPSTGDTTEMATRHAQDGA